MSLDDLQEKIGEFEDYVQSSDVAAMQSKHCCFRYAEHESNGIPQSCELSARAGCCRLGNETVKARLGNSYCVVLFRGSAHGCHEIEPFQCISKRQMQNIKTDKHVTYFLYWARLPTRCRLAATLTCTVRHLIWQSMGLCISQASLTYRSYSL